MDSNHHATMLYFARCERWDKVDEILAEGANINYRDPLTGENLLSMAVDQDNLTMVEKLLEAGSKVNIRNAIGQSPIFFARSGAMLRLLDKYSANPYLKAEHRYIAFWYVVNANNPDCLREYIAIWGLPAGQPSKSLANAFLRLKWFEMFEVLTGNKVSDEEATLLRSHEWTEQNENKTKRLIRSILLRCEFANRTA